MNVHEHFENLYGEMNLSPRDAARWVFASGWNSALEELLKRLNTMPLTDAARAACAVHVGGMMHIDPSEVQDTMQ